jgi:hypothetical protein
MTLDEIRTQFNSKDPRLLHIVVEAAVKQFSNP